ncbi:MAG: efflux RND transporter periplasmic adaptor subunit, partial [Anaerolineae bacterium]|nr:efflux RND transporter periplasmic adaptor subunit [Anaerolineae bacterium]
MNNKSKNRKKWIWVGVGVVVIILIAAIALPRIFGDQIAASQQDQAGTGDTVTAFMGDLSANASASGQVKAQREARLALPTSGDVAEIYVALGDEVAEGDPLLKLDTQTLERAVESAKQALLIQEANHEALIAPPTASNLAAAEAGVASAQAQLDDLLAGPSEEDIAASDANVRAAQANVWAASEQLQLAQSGASESQIASAQAELIGALSQQEATQELYDKLTECFSFDLPDGSDRNFCPGLGDPEEQTRYNLQTANANAAAAQASLNALLDGPDTNAVSIAQASLAAASANLEAAKANHQLLLNGASAAQIAGAEAALAQAKASLETLQNGPSAGQRAMSEIGVEQARISLQKAEDDLADATLYAPFAGAITAVYVNEGETASGILMEIVDSNNLEVVLAVDEVDIGDIAIGQPATISFESWPDQEISSQVASISPRNVQGNTSVVSYEVFIGLGETDLPVLVGMTANADLLTNNFENVLLVPNEAIDIDRSKGTYSVNRVTTDADGNQTTETVQVTIGLRDNNNTQIISGLNEGDILLVGNTAPVFNFRRDENGDGGGPPRDE